MTDSAKIVETHEKLKAKYAYTPLFWLSYLHGMHRTSGDEMGVARVLLPLLHGMPTHDAHLDDLICYLVALFGGNSCLDDLSVVEHPAVLAAQAVDVGGLARILGSSFIEAENPSTILLISAVNLVFQLGFSAEAPPGIDELASSVLLVAAQNVVSQSNEKMAVLRSLVVVVTLALNVELPKGLWKKVLDGAENKQLLALLGATISPECEISENIYSVVGFDRVGWQLQCLLQGSVGWQAVYVSPENWEIKWRKLYKKLEAVDAAAVEAPEPEPVAEPAPSGMTNDDFRRLLMMGAQKKPKAGAARRKPTEKIES